MRAAALRALGLAVAAGSFGGCGDNYSAVFDSLPIALTRAPMGGGMGGHGALVALAARARWIRAIVPDAGQHRDVR